MTLIGLSASLDMTSEKHWEGSARSRVNQAYVESILQAGATPLIIPVMEDEGALQAALETCQGLLLTGGQDIAPLLYGQEPRKGLGEVSDQRDRYDLALFSLARSMNLPVFGICRGMQLINVAEGGDLYQDLADQDIFSLKHLQEGRRNQVSHTVSLEKGSRLHALLGDRVPVNSFHHQAVKELAPGYRPAAWSEDRVLEAMEAEDMDRKPVFAVQWHPEELAAEREDMASLFSYFVAICEKRGS